MQQRIDVKDLIGACFPDLSNHPSDIRIAICLSCHIFPKETDDHPDAAIGNPLQVNTQKLLVEFESVIEVVLRHGFLIKERKTKRQQIGFVPEMLA